MEMKVFCYCLKSPALDISSTSKWKTSSLHHCREGDCVTSLSINDSQVELWKICQNDYLHEIMLVDLSLKLQS